MGSFVDDIDVSGEASAGNDTNTHFTQGPTVNTGGSGGGIPAWVLVAGAVAVAWIVMRGR